MDGPSWPILTAALVFTDELERAIEICDAALADARERGSALGFATVGYCRTWPLYEQARLLDAAADAEAAVDARLDDVITGVRTAYGALACCHLQRGEFEQAETALATIDDPGDARESAVSLSPRRARTTPTRPTPPRGCAGGRHATPVSVCAPTSRPTTPAPSPGVRPPRSPTWRLVSRSRRPSWPRPSWSARNASASREPSSAISASSAWPKAAPMASSYSPKRSASVNGIPLARNSKQRIGTWFGGQANRKRSWRPPHQGISTGGRSALRMIGL